MIILYLTIYNKNNNSIIIEIDQMISSKKLFSLGMKH